MKKILTQKEDDLIKKCAILISKAKKIVFFTGAGMSAESGIKTFRGGGGFWTGLIGKIGLGIFGTPNYGWKYIPYYSYKVYKKFFWDEIAKAKPNKGHISISELEKIIPNLKVMTRNFFIINKKENVDGLHQLGGVKRNNVYELHGTVRKYCCTLKKHDYDFKTPFVTEIPDCSPICKVEGCESYIRPKATLFKECLPLGTYIKCELYIKEMSKDDIMIVIGCSHQVFPAAQLPLIAYSKKIRIIEINIEETNISDFTDVIFLKGKSGDILSKLVEKVKKIQHI